MLHEGALSHDFGCARQRQQRLGAARLQGEFGFVSFPVGDVARDAKQADDLSTAVAQGPFGGKKDALAIDRIQCLLVAGGPVRREYALIVGADQLGLLRREQCRVIMAQRLLRLSARDARGFVVEQ